MAWEWAGPASGALVGLAGALAGWLVAAGGRKNDERLTGQRHAHELQLEHGRWHRDRRAEAYMQLLDLAEDVASWLTSVSDNWESLDDPLPSAPSVLAHQSPVWARISAYATPSVCEHIKVWRSHMASAVDVATVLVEYEREGQAGRDLGSLCIRERVARYAMSESIAKDLARFEGAADAEDRDSGVSR
jgi:hypothetical protein